MNRNILAVAAASLFAAGTSAWASASVGASLEQLQFTLSHLDPSDTSTPSVTFTTPTSTIDIQVGEDVSNRTGDPLHTVSEPGLLVPFSLQESAVGAGGFGTLDDDPTNPGNTMQSNADTIPTTTSAHPYSYVKSGVGSAFVLSPDTRLEFTAYTNLGAILESDSGSIEAAAGLEFFLADAAGDPLTEVASQFSRIELSGRDGNPATGQFLTVDFDNTGTQAIDGYFDGYALSAADSAPPGPAPEPANVILLLAALGVFGVAGKLRERRSRGGPAASASPCAASQRAGGASIHSCAGSLRNTQCRCGPAITLR